MNGPRAKRIALLLLVVMISVGQRADDTPPLRVRAGICEDKNCLKRSQVGFAPARINVQVYLRQHPDNRGLVYGVSCDSVIVAESRAQVDGAADPPLFVVEYRDVGAGDCVALAILVRADGSQIRAQSERILIQSRLGD